MRGLFSLVRSADGPISFSPFVFCRNPLCRPFGLVFLAIIAGDNFGRNFWHAFSFQIRNHQSNRSGAQTSQDLQIQGCLNERYQSSLQGQKGRWLMSIRSNLATASFVFTSTMAAIGAACAQSASPSAASEPTQATASLEGNYQGTLVCEQMPYAAGPLRAPLDINVSGNNAKFARPVFTLDGSRVIGSEIGGGTLDGDKLHLVSSWVTSGAAAQANYEGTLTAKGGTLTGSQSWVLGGEPHSRQCFAAVVKARIEPPTR
jgi:hypothetical protein